MAFNGTAEPREKCPTVVDTLGNQRFVLSRVHQWSRNSLPRSPNVGPLLPRVDVGLREDKPTEQVRRELKA